MISFDKFCLSLKRLEELHEYRHRQDSYLAHHLQEALAESVIHRFKTCYDCLWKVLKRYLDEELAVPNAPNSPKGVFRLADHNNLLSSQIEQWIRYANTRIATSHDCDGETVEACIALLSHFIDDAIGLYATLSGMPWEYYEPSISLRSNIGVFRSCSERTSWECQYGSTDRR